MILSFGGVFATDDDQNNMQFTHHVMDRPLLGSQLKTNRDYVQPQWIVDSLNNLYLLPTAPYKPGQAPPPHLSPFVDDLKEGYIPPRQKEINALKGEVVEEPMEDDVVSEEEEEVKEVKKTNGKVAAVDGKKKK